MGILCCKCPKDPTDENSDPLVQTVPIENQSKVTLEDFETLSLLGKGAFAKVVLVRKKSNGQLYAMKMLKKREISRRNEGQHIQSERKILASVKSPFLVNLKYAFQTNHKLYMVMEFMPGGELFYHLNLQRRFSEEIARFYISEVIIAIEYLHNQSIIYRDLKPENILLAFDGHIKLTDFGLSKNVSESNYKTRTICGTPEYQAPEIILDCEYDRAVDFWSIGCLLYELISGRPPFQDDNRDYLRAKILSQNVVFSRIFSEAARNLIDKLLVKNVKTIQPSHRLTDIKALKAHEFFDGVLWDKVAKKSTEAPYKPRQDGETENFDRAFTTENPLSANMSPSPQSGVSAFIGFTYKDPSLLSEPIT